MTRWWTFGLQVVNFVALVWLLRRFLYRPVLATLAERRKRTEEAISKVAATQEASDQARAALEVERAGLEAERQRVIEGARARADVERTELLAKAKADADAVVATGLRTLADERVAAIAMLEAHAAELATSLAARLLGEIGSPAIDDAFLARLEAYLDALPAERLRSLAGEAAGGVEVVTAHPLDPDAVARWRDRLIHHLGSTARVGFASDPSLIAGVELQFRSAIVHLSWRDALGDAGRAMRTHAIAG